MELRYFLFKNRITQISIIRKGREKGHCLNTSNVSKFVHGQELWPYVKAGIRAALAGLGYRQDEIDKIDELKPKAV